MSGEECCRRLRVRYSSVKVLACLLVNPRSARMASMIPGTPGMPGVAFRPVSFAPVRAGPPARRLCCGRLRLPRPSSSRASPLGGEQLVDRGAGALASGRACTVGTSGDLASVRLQGGPLPISVEHDPALVEGSKQQQRCGRLYAI